MIVIIAWYNSITSILWDYKQCFLSLFSMKTLCDGPVSCDGEAGTGLAPADSSCWELLLSRRDPFWIFCIKWYRSTHRVDSICTSEIGMILGKAISAGYTGWMGSDWNSFIFFHSSRASPSKTSSRTPGDGLFKIAFSLFGLIIPYFSHWWMGTCLPGEKGLTLLGLCGDGMSRSPNANLREESTLYYRPKRVSKYLLLM